MSKTNAVRLLEAQNIPYSIIEYDFNEDEIDAVSVAKKIGAEPESVFKTLVAVNERNEFFVFVIPGNFELNLKNAARVTGNKNIELIKVKDLQPLTGYLRGGCSPIGMKKQYPTFIDENAQLFNNIFVSAGARGIQLNISPDNLCNITNAKFAELI